DPIALHQLANDCQRGALVRVVEHVAARDLAHDRARLVPEPVLSRRGRNRGGRIAVERARPAEVFMDLRDLLGLHSFREATLLERTTLDRLALSDARGFFTKLGGAFLERLLLELGPWLDARILTAEPRLLARDTSKCRDRSNSREIRARADHHRGSEQRELEDIFVDAADLVARFVRRP